jgi:ATP-binding cassette subfamily B protein
MKFKKYPTYQQLDHMDCGATCLRMIARYHGQVYSAQTLRERCSVSREGASFSTISEGAEGIGFHTLAVRTTWERIVQEAPTPFIVYWNQNHFVVVYRITRQYVMVGDPAVGRLLRYTRADFLTSWLNTAQGEAKQGVALLLEPMPDFYTQADERKLTRPSWGYWLGYLRPYRGLVSTLGMSLLLGSLLQVLVPFLTQSIVDVGIHTRNLPFIYLVLAGQLMLFVSRTSVDFHRRWLLLHLSTRINLTLLSDFLARLTRLPIAFFDSKQTGDLMQRLNDNQRIQNFLSTSSLSTLFSVFNLVLFGAVLGYYNLPIFGVFVLGSCLYFAWVWVFLRKRRDLDHQRFQQAAGNQSNVMQLLNGMQEIKLHNAELPKRWEWERIQAKVFKIQIRGIALEQYQQGGSMFISEATQLFITFLSAKAVLDGQMTLGMMLAVQYLIGQVNAPVQQLIQFMYDWQDAHISLERLNEIRQRPAEDEGRTTVNLLPEDKNLHLQGLAFQYEGSSHAKVLEDVSLLIPAGKVTAIVGTSGSGKTTLLKLLLKYYEPTQGKITLGNMPLSAVNSRLWRDQCGVVMQDGFIFSDTIARNIGMQDETIDIPRLRLAVKTACLLDFIETLPLGFHSKIGAEGMGLSGGQKQRILLARAIYKNPDYLFLDEATSSLDANNESVIMYNLQTFFEGKTVVIIAHRLSTVQHADQIVVLEKGKIVEIGTHTELAQAQGLYYDLVKNQLALGE